MDVEGSLEELEYLYILVSVGVLGPGPLNTMEWCYSQITPDSLCLIRPLPTAPFNSHAKKHQVSLFDHLQNLFSLVWSGWASDHLSSLSTSPFYTVYQWWLQWVTVYHHLQVFFSSLRVTLSKTILSPLNQHTEMKANRSWRTLLFPQTWKTKIVCSLLPSFASFNSFVT